MIYILFLVPNTKNYVTKDQAASYGSLGKAGKPL
jgi:hypothetical protein